VVLTEVPAVFVNVTVYVPATVKFTDAKLTETEYPEDTPLVSWSDNTAKLVPIGTDTGCTPTMSVPGE